MKPLQPLDCGCAPSATPTTRSAPPSPRRLRWPHMLLGLAALVAWWLVYVRLKPWADVLAFDLLGLTPGSRLGEAVAFFLYDAPKVLLLLTLIVFLVGVVRSFFSPETTRALLARRGEWLGNVLASGLGVLTPFCTCSAVPLFLGFVAAGVPLGATFSFLIAAPLVNEVALVLLWGLVGWRVALLYAATGLAIAMVSGWVLGRMRLDHLLEDWVRQLRQEGGAAPQAALDWPARLAFGLQAVRDVVGKVWPWILLGIAVGAGIHGYVPEGFLVGLMGREAWWSVPVVVALGIPMYANAAGIVPVVQALLAKGAALGTALAFMMSVIALSFPEAVILRKILKPRLIALFFGIVGTGILLVGWLFNLIL